MQNKVYTEIKGKRITSLPVYLMQFNLSFQYDGDNDRILMQGNVNEIAGFIMSCGINVLDFQLKEIGKTLKCCKCGVEIKGGFFNAPSGVHCCDCWENKVPESRKNKELKQSLTELAAIGIAVNKANK